MDNKIIMGIVIVIILVAVAVGIFFFQEPEPEPIKMAALLWLSNPEEDGPKGIKNFRDGLLLAAEEINDRGGINNRPIELLISDTQGDPEKAVVLFEQIEEEHHPLVYLVLVNSVTTALEELVKEHEVVLLSGTSAPIESWTFGYYPSVVKENELLLSMLEEQSVETLGVLYIDRDFGRASFEAIEQEFGRHVQGEAYAPGTTDFRGHAERLLDLDAIEIVSVRPDTLAIVQDIRRVNYAGSIFISSNNFAPEFFNMSSMQGVYGPAFPAYNPNFLLAKEIREKYEAQYLGDFDFHVGLGYDLIYIFDGLLEGEELSRKKVKDILEQGFDFTGAFGTINVPPGSNDISPNLLPAQIQDGKLKYI